MPSRNVQVIRRWCWKFKPHEDGVRQREAIRPSVSTSCSTFQTVASCGFATTRRNPWNDLAPAILLLSLPGALELSALSFQPRLLRLAYHGRPRHVWSSRPMSASASKPTRKPPRPPDADRYWWRYHQVSRFRWWGHAGQGIGMYGGGFSAFTERRLRRKLARFLRKQRRKDYWRIVSERSSR